MTPTIPPVADDEAMRIASKLTKVQREAVLAARRRRTGAGGELWTFSLLKEGTRRALTKLNVAKPWGLVSADLTPLGLRVRSALQNEGTGDGK